MSVCRLTNDYNRLKSRAFQNGADRNVTRVCMDKVRNLSLAAGKKLKKQLSLQLQVSAAGLRMEFGGEFDCRDKRAG